MNPDPAVTREVLDAWPTLDAEQRQAANEMFAKSLRGWLADAGAETDEQIRAGLELIATSAFVELQRIARAAEQREASADPELNAERRQNGGKRW